MPEEYPDGTRYAGMHVNISTGDTLDSIDALRLDAILGLTSVRDWEQEYKEQIRQRRTVYGRAGEHRLPEFGIEYRTLPATSWECTTGTELFSLVKQALSLDKAIIIPFASQIQQAIDTCDAGIADDILQQITQ